MPRAEGSCRILREQWNCTARLRLRGTKPPCAILRTVLRRGRVSNGMKRLHFGGSTNAMERSRANRPGITWGDAISWVLAQQETREKLGPCLGNASGSWGGKADEIFVCIVVSFNVKLFNWLMHAPFVRLHDLQMSVLNCTRKEYKEQEHTYTRLQMPIFYS